MDLSYLNSIEAEKLEEYFALAGSLSLCLDSETLGSLGDYSRQEKQLISKLSTLIDGLAQKHQADLRSFFQNHEYLKKPVLESLQKSIQRWHLAESFSPFQ